MKAIGEWENELYANQNDAIRAIITEFTERDPNVHFYLRMHPNLGKVDNQQTKELYDLQSDNFTLIRPFDPVDSFAMVENCEKSITFGSTIGVEATFWGKPSILFGKSFYDDIDCVYKPNSYEQLFTWIANPNLPPKPKENALKYGLFVNTYGVDTKTFNYDGKFNSTFRGTTLKRITPRTIQKAIELLPNLPLWNRLNKILFRRKLNFKDLFVLKSHTVE